MQFFLPALTKLGHSRIFQGNEVAYIARCSHNRFLKYRKTDNGS